ncbi:MAG: RNA 2',3'-cyclic phosphodiesterase [bacterium]|nr:RNA 2',3'-cyclic phosphodiesterase [bacterium]
MEVIRSFIAIKIPADIQKKLQGIQDKLKQSAAHVSWIHPENIHLTLKFLGNIEGTQVDEITAGLRNSVKGLSPFQLQVGYAGAFPNIRFPRVIWVGVTDDEAGSLKILQTELSNNLAQIGFEKENERFQPHLTLGRVRSQKNRSNLLRAIEAMVNIWVGEVPVKSVYLIESELKSTGAEYTDLAEITL